MKVKADMLIARGCPRISKALISKQRFQRRSTFKDSVQKERHPAREKDGAPAAMDSSGEMDTRIFEKPIFFATRTLNPEPQVDFFTGR